MLLRRSFTQAEVALTRSGLCLDTNTKIAVYDGVPLELSIREFAILEELSPQTEQKHLSITIRDMAGKKVTGNRVMIYRVMSNLIENAVKYSRERGFISISSETGDEHIVVKISDTGIGIEKAELERIFEPFYRVDKSRSRAVGGAGLELALVKDIMEKHGGSIAVESVYGEGTVFILYFPHHTV